MKMLERTYILIFVVTLICFSVTLASNVSSVYAEDNNKVSAKTDGGLHTVTVDTPRGKIKVNLPDDMSAGDTISGTVVAEPSGNNAQERQTNSDELNGYVVEMKTEDKELGETKTGVGKLTGVQIPVDISGAPAKIVVSDPEGQEIIVTDLPVRDSPHPLQHTKTPSPEDFKLPLVGQAGEPLQVMGPFDGKFDSTAVKIGGQETNLIAESPRKVIVRSPVDIEGPTKIEVVERGVRAKGEFYNADVNKPPAVKTLEGIWQKVGGKSTWRITIDGGAVSAYSVKVPQEDQIRGYKPNVNIVRAQLRGSLIHGRIQQFFTIPIKECMAVCPAQCEQWNELMLVLSQDGKMLKGQIKEKALDTSSCAVVEFGWRPWTMIAVPDSSRLQD
jgi:hypothetical protein